MNTIILIPPSEGKAQGGKGKIIKPSAEIKEVLSKLSTANPSKLYSGTEKSINEAIQINKDILISHTMPAINRYTGVVYDAINYDTLKNKDAFNKHVRIISGLFGLVKPTDLIPNYKLKMGNLGLAKFWKPIISKQLKETFVIDLLPQEHKKAVEYSNGVEVEFIITKNGRQKPAGHFGKKVKGLFVRWLCENEITDVEKMKDFTSEGFSFKKEVEGKLVFEKEEK